MQIVKKKKALEKDGKSTLSGIIMSNCIYTHVHAALLLKLKYLDASDSHSSLAKTVTSGLQMDFDFDLLKKKYRSIS